MSVNLTYLKDLAIVLTAKELKARYKSTFFGFLWVFVNPLLQMLVLSIVFKFFFKIQLENYPIFLFSGLLPWMFLTLSLTAGTSVFVDNRDILKKVVFPREILPLSAIFANFFNFIIAIAILIAVLAPLGFINFENLLLLPTAIVLHLVLTVGLVLLTSSLNVVFRDVFYIIQAVIILWFYLTPIFYPVSFVPERFLSIYGLNPMVGIVGLYRYSLMGKYLPDFVNLVSCVIISLLIFMVGFVIFEKRKTNIADFV